MFKKFKQWVSFSTLNEEASEEERVKSVLFHLFSHIKNSYRYDGAGNILSASDGTTTHTYTYGNAKWKDLLTAYDGKELHYDGAGNPLTYQNGTEWTLAWEDGRRLSTATSADGTKITYTYDLDGTRRSKTVDGVAHYYIWEGGRL